MAASRQLKAIAYTLIGSILIDSQEQMEDEDWLSVRSYQDIEAGKVNPRLSSLMVICSKLKIELHELLAQVRRT